VPALGNAPPAYPYSRRRVHLTAEASHSINWEQPEAFNHHVLEFIRRH
jgi:pimeloyl-ACP methyl ester carboxylesterase